MTKRQMYLNYKLTCSDRINNVFESMYIYIYIYRRNEFQMKNGKAPNVFEEDRIDAHRRVTA